MKLTSENIEEFEKDFNKKVRAVLRVVVPLGALGNLICLIKLFFLPFNFFLTAVIFTVFILFLYYTYRTLTYQEDED